jgi:tight adherence protein B
MDIAVFFLLALVTILTLLLYGSRLQARRRREQTAAHRLTGTARMLEVDDLTAKSASTRQQNVAGNYLLVFIQPISTAMAQAGLTMRPGTMFGLMAGLFIGGSSVATLRFGLAVAVACGSLLAAAPIMVLRLIRRRRLRSFAQQLPYGLDLLRAALESGHTLLRALQMSTENLPEPICSELRLLVEHVRLGMSLPAAVDVMHQRVPIDELGFLAAAVRLQNQIGSSLASILAHVGQSMRTRSRLEDQVRTITAQSRASAIIVTLLPVVVLAAFELLRPGYVGLLFHNPTGVRLLETAVVLDTIAFFTMRRIVKVDY